jgi:hypothetical protein
MILPTDEPDERDTFHISATLRIAGQYKDCVDMLQ